MSFFIKSQGKAASKKKVLKNRKADNSREKVQATKKKRKLPKDEEIPSDSDFESGDEGVPSVHSESEEETTQEKRLRLTKQYLADLEKEEREKQDDDDVDREVISHILQQDHLEQTGKLWKQIADTYIAPSPDDVIVLRGHQLAVTCVVISTDCKHIFSASKDCSIIKWDVKTHKKLKVIHGGRKGTETKHKGHTAHILALALSSDGKFLASGDANRLIHIWNPETCELIHTFTGHRGPVTGLAFRKGTHQLFSCSQDRSVKIWSVAEMAYVETLLGHQDQITCIDSLSRDRAVTSGGRDGSVRIWKVVEESQLVFHGHKGCIDCVSLINEEHFVTGAEDNSLALWGVLKKKPLAMVQNAHDGSLSDGVAGTEQENWITSVASHQTTDLIASGSKDGCIKFWKCAQDFKSLQPLFSLPVAGFINSLAFSTDGSLLVAGVGQEHRMGRWWRIKESKNSICIINMKKTDT
ncbi:unnamed protein product [Owenia fusiformis]|uniref:U3 small nucleolar RNA-interacting protein 2 n=1 Tax=Owenia fusiformis TaxID=6347 RepID=A0A8S4NM55_OWEFU|nr:unnamed protein product [Owenia fusiformis]